MKKQLLFLVVMMLPLVASAYDIEVKNADGVTIYYNYINDGTELEVTHGNNYSYYYINGYIGDVVIPEEVVYMNRTRKVTRIGNNTFYYCTSLTSVTIPDGVTSIDGGAFGECNRLTSVTIPNSVSSIGDAAFRGCSKLTSITIPSNVMSINFRTFYECSGLTSITIPNSVTNIGDAAFYGCSSLTSITIPNSVTSIGTEAFRGCYSLTSITIPYGISCINESAFRGCKSLTSISIPNSVTSIDNNAFYGCTSLTSITIPNSVTSIGFFAFSTCSKLSSIMVDANNTKYDSRENCNAIIETSTNTLVVGCKVTVIPNSVTRIGNDAFSGCSDLTSIIIPNSVTSIGSFAFENCSGLTSITIPNSVTRIETDAFKGVDFSTIISLIENPFKILGKSSTNRTFSLNTFNNATLYVPKGTVDNYKSTEGWKDFVFIEEGVPSGIEQPLSKTRQIQSEDGVLTIQNIKDGTSVSVYNANGTFVGSTISQNERAIINTNMQPGSVAIVKIAEQSVKVVIK